MLFKRFVLVFCINKAKENYNKKTYYELLKVFYKLLEQEQIDSRFINDLYYYDYISDETIAFYSLFRHLQSTEEPNEKSSHM